MNGDPKQIDQFLRRLNPHHEQLWTESGALGLPILVSWFLARRLSVPQEQGEMI
jgi:hypothetical protein